MHIMKMRVWSMAVLAAVAVGVGCVSAQAQDVSAREQAAQSGDAAAQFEWGVNRLFGVGATKDEADAVEWLRKAAEQGDARAQFALGVCLRLGKGVEEDDAAAVEWFRKAAEQGHAQAQTSLGICLAFGQGVEKDGKEALEWYIKAIRQGAARAIAYLGSSYYFGIGVAEDKRHAVPYFRRAAEMGSAYGQKCYGWSLFRGEGVPPDAMESLKWLRAAADQGDAGSMVNLAFVLDNGLSDLEDEEERQRVVARLYLTAAERNHKDAQNNMGHFYRDGIGAIEKNPYKAFYWFHKAAEQGHTGAQYWLAEYYSNLKYPWYSPEEAFRWYRISAEHGEAKAQFVLAEKLREGDGVAQDMTEAIVWYRKAVAQNYAKAINGLGECYENGWGVEQDAAKAVQLYREAAVARQDGTGGGLFRAQENLARCHLLGIGVEKNEAVAANWWRHAAIGKIYDSPEGMNNFGVCCELGVGVEKNLKEAVTWYRKGAEQANVYAQYNLGRCFEYGIGVRRSRVEAAKWYKKASRKLIRPAVVALDRMGVKVIPLNYPSGRYYGVAHEPQKVQEFTESDPVEPALPPRFSFSPLTAEEEAFTLCKPEVIYMEEVPEGFDDEVDDEITYYKIAMSLMDRAEKLISEGNAELAVRCMKRVLEFKDATPYPSLALCAHYGIGMPQDARLAADFARKGVNSEKLIAFIVQDLVGAAQPTEPASEAAQDAPKAPDDIHVTPRAEEVPGDEDENDL